MAGEGISIAGDGKGVVINGVRCGLVSDVACDMATRTTGNMPLETALARSARLHTLTPAEARIAGKAFAFLERMRASGYSAKETRRAFTQKIVDEAQRVKPDDGDPEDASEQGKSNAVREG